MLLSIKWLVCIVTAILVLSQADAFPSVWKREAATGGEILDQISEPPSVCDSQICQRDATEILESLDKSVDPCEDFYQFACGGWKEKHPATEDTPVVDRGTEVDKYLSEEVKRVLTEHISEDDISPLIAAKKMYNVCMDVDTIERAGIQPLVELSNEFGGWPMALEHWNETNFNLESTLTEFDRRLGWSPLFDTTNYISTNRTSKRVKYVIHIDKASSVVPTISLLDPDHEEKQSKYVIMVANTSYSIMNSTRVNIDEGNVLQQSREMYDFIIQLQNINSGNLTSDMTTLKELQELTDSALVGNTNTQFNWLSYLNNVLSSTGVVLDENELAYVSYKDYLFELFQLLDNTPKRIIANYLQWMLIDELNQKTKMGINDFTVPTAKSPPRSTYCREVTMERFNHVVNSRLVRDMLNKTDKALLDRILENIQSSYLNIISNADWMDEATRSTLKGQVETMRAHMGYPAMYNNDTALVEYYKQVKVSNKHFSNMLIMTLESSTRSLQRFGDNVDGDRVWNDMRPETQIAYYTPYTHEMLISFAKLLPFNFKAGRLESLNYGRIGTTIGHVVMHGLAGLLEDDWENAELANLKARSQCFVDQYNSYHLSELEDRSGTNVTLDGEKTLDENLADSCSMHAAYDTYKSETSPGHHYDQPQLPGLEEFSQDQLFFIGFGTAWCESRTKDSLKKYISMDSHAPPSLRVRGTVSNMEPFATAFNCPAGSNMNPVNKCRMW